MGVISLDLITLLQYGFMGMWGNQFGRDGDKEESESRPEIGMEPEGVIASL